MAPLGDFGCYDSHEVWAHDNQNCYSFDRESISTDFCPNFEAFILKHLNLYYWSKDGIVSYGD
jgi:hypothetical protein